jgi:hypothetical protein
VTAAGAAPAGVGEARVPAPTRTPSWLAGAADATEVALFAPLAWPVALAGFLVRGGLAVFVLPIVVLPTVTGLATALGPVIILLALTGTSPTVVPLVAATAIALLAWWIGGGLLGAATDIVLVRSLGPTLGRRLGRPGAAPAGRGSWSLIWRAMVIRSAAHLLLVPAFAWAALRVVAAVYRELTTPGDVAVPLVFRVVASVPEALLLLAVAWLVGETVGALAVRWLVLDGRGVAGSFGGAARSLVRSPIGAVATAVLATVGSILLIAPPLVLSAWAWDATRRAILGELGLGVMLAPIALVVVWCAGLVLAGIASAWRSALWTAEMLRGGPPDRHR